MLTVLPSSRRESQHHSTSPPPGSGENSGFNAAEVKTARASYPPPTPYALLIYNLRSNQSKKKAIIVVPYKNNSPSDHRKARYDCATILEIFLLNPQT